MITSSSPPQLRLIQGLNPKGRIKDGIYSEFTVGEFAQENQDKLDALAEERERLTVQAGIVGLVSIAGFILFSPSAIGSLPPLGKLLGKLQGASQRFFVMTELIKEFEEENIAIEVGLKPDGLREIDFFLRFPDKEYILLQLRSLGSVKVSYSETHQALRFRKRKGNSGGRTWKPDPLIELSEQERWIRNYQSHLLGTSSRDKRRPIAKAIILMSETILGDHSEHLWDRIDQQNYLILRRGGTFNLVEKDRVSAFIRSYLASRRSAKNS